MRLKSIHVHLASRQVTSNVIAADHAQSLHTLYNNVTGFEKRGHLEQNRFFLSC